MAKSRKSEHDSNPDPEVTESPEAAPQSAGDTTTGDIDRERLAARAYELFLARGGGDGQAMDDWLAAEREIGNGSTRNEE